MLMYMFIMTANANHAAGFRVRCRMHQPVAVGAASGTATAGLILTVLRQFLAAPTGLETCLVPSALPEPELPGWVHSPSFLCGLAIGLLAGPLLDLAWLLRQRWRRFVWSCAAENSNPRPLHKVLA